MQKYGLASQTNFAEYVYSDSQHIYNRSPQRHNPTDDDEAGALIITRAAATGVDAAPNIVDAAACWRRRRHHHLLASNRPEIGSRPGNQRLRYSSISSREQRDEPATEHCHVSNRLHFQLDTVAAELTGGYISATSSTD